MHPPLLRPHPECQEEIKALMDCHEKNPYKKFFGACNEPKTTLDVCFAMEKEKSRRANSEKARKFDEEFERELERSRREKEAAQTR